MKFLIVNWIFQKTEASNLDIKQGTIISKVNGEDVSTIEKLKEILENKSEDDLEIVSFTKEKFVIKKDPEENKRIANSLKVELNQY
jgi:S1-C subfamily serine protease